MWLNIFVKLLISDLISSFVQRWIVIRLMNCLRLILFWVVSHTILPLTIILFEWVLWIDNFHLNYLRIRSDHTLCLIFFYRTQKMASRNVAAVFKDLIYRSGFWAMYLSVLSIPCSIWEITEWDSLLRNKSRSPSWRKTARRYIHINDNLANN